MKEEPNEIHAPLLRAHLQAAGLDLPILHFPEIDSTNLEVQRQLDAGRSPPFAILASKQQSGRGRLGRKWHSPEEGNCYLSFALIPDSGGGRDSATDLLDRPPSLPSFEGLLADSGSHEMAE